MDWQPIGTAPKDGSVILLRGGPWSDEFAGPFPVGAARWLTTRQGFEGWAVAVAEAGYNITDYEKPTEWAALPSD